MVGERPIVLLAAHGERGGAANNARLAALVESVGDALPEADVGSVLASVDGAVARALAVGADRPAVCLPLLFSDGYFYRERLQPHFSGSLHRLAPPLALWGRFAPFLADNLVARLGSSHADPRVILVAHGSAKIADGGSRSAVVARQVARRLGASYGRISVGFLEEAPLARELVAVADPPFALVGLFLGEGRHGQSDFSALAAAAPHGPVAAFTVGDLTGLGGLIVDEARVWLAALRAG